VSEASCQQSADCELGGKCGFLFEQLALLETVVELSERAVEEVPLTCGGEGGRGEVRGDGCQDLDCLGDVAVDGGDPDAEPGCELGIGVAAPEVGQGQQGLTDRAQLAPPRAPPGVGGQQVGEMAQGRAGQIDPRWVDKHVKLQADRLILVDNPSTRSFTYSRTPPPRQLAAQSPKLNRSLSLTTTATNTRHRSRAARASRDLGAELDRGEH
jgi:hypothetical protein